MASKGKRFFRWLIIIGIIVLAVITNPKKEKHIEKINKEIYDLVPENNNKSMIEKLGNLFTNPILDNLLEYENYFVYSQTKMKFLGEKTTVSYGFFGLVFLTDDADKIDK